MATTPFTARSQKPRSLLVVAVLLLCLFACQSKDANRSSNMPPSNFTYSSDHFDLPVGKPITPLVPIGADLGVTFSTRGLPWGLNLDTNSGVISGTPKGASPLTSYSIIATKQVWKDGFPVNLETASIIFIVVHRNGFIPTGSMVTGRHDHTATLIQGAGKVLIAGGSNNGQVLANAELYDPATGVFTPTGSMHTPRVNHTAIALPNGTVLFFGGDDGTTILSSIEEYNIRTGVFREIGSLKVARHFHSSTLFFPPSPTSSPTILVAGGEGLNGWLTGTELFDATRGLSSLGPSMLTARGRHGACGAWLFGNPSVIVAGGFNGSFLSSVEYYSSIDGVFHAAGPLSVALADFSMTDQAKPFGNAYILISGGVGDGGVSSGLGLYIYYSNGGAPPPYFESGPSMGSARQGHTSVYLWNEMRSFIVGGIDSVGHVLSSAELYDIIGQTISPAGSMNAPRARHTATYLDNGLVLITGGIDATGKSLSSAEMY